MNEAARRMPTEVDRYRLSDDHADFLPAEVAATDCLQTKLANVIETDVTAEISSSLHAFTPTRPLS